MHISIVTTFLFCIYSFICCINAQGPYGAPMPNLGGGYGNPLPPPMMQGSYGMEDYGPQQFGAYGNHPLPHGYGPKPPPPAPQGMGGYGNPEMPPFAAQPARTFENGQQGYGQNNGYNKPIQGGFGDNGINEGFGFEGFKESNDEATSSSSPSTASAPAHSNH